MRSVPEHVAIIMDGNGRWATARGKPRLEGHKAGSDAARLVVESAAELGIKHLTLFGFSSENWNRPAEEVNGLISLLRFYLKKEVSELNKNGVRLLVIGDRDRFDDEIKKLINNAEKLTANNTKITVTVAFSYGGRQDIVNAAQNIAKKVQSGELQISEIDEDIFSKNLMTKELPDPDLIIRTSGENRVSNFLMWQMAYSEILFTNALWPDFSKKDLEEAIEEFNNRERRYGSVPDSKIIGTK